MDSLQRHSSILTSERKKRSKIGIPGVATIEEVRNYKLLSTYSGLHSAASPGILCLDIAENDFGKFIATGGNDGNIVVFDKEKELVINTLKGHLKKINTVIFHPTEEMILSSSYDNTIRLWNLTEENGSSVLDIHQNSTSDISLHPCGKYLLSGTRDGNWGFTDIHNNQLILRVEEEELYRGINCAKFHPDGLIFGLGNSNSSIRIWDLRGPINVATFDHHNGLINSMSFSENGENSLPY
ncbi:pre-mRNA-processing factor 19-like, partial [Octopus sinensis]|uniref:Pre-mRNA-processing factor 19 n=1 Tax=Octopus sinensis TaxID=2607531 RepID=A0A6P7U184_9MOLL